MRLNMAEIAQACQGRIFNAPPTPVKISTVVRDSREVANGALFFALHGPNFDGHAYIKQAFENGAVCAVTEREIDKPCIVVPDTRRALLDLAACYRRSFCDVKVVAITGSAGKTTTKDMIASVLSQKYKTKKTIGNYNNDIGVPLTLFQLEEGDEVIVVEMGMNHAGEIHELSLTAAPDIAVITNIGDAHIENFGNREGILQAKLEITDGLKEDGMLIVNGDDPLLYKIQKGIKCNINKLIIQPLGLAGSLYNIGSQVVNIKLPGEHMVMNALLAAKVGEAFGLNDLQIKAGIEAFTPSKDRMEIIEANGLRIINDSYNANPEAMKAAIGIVGGLKDLEGRKVCILGDMFELGGHAEELHKDVGHFAARQGVILIAIGSLAKHMAEGYNVISTGALHFADKNDFLSRWKDILRPGDTVLLKASNGMAFNELLKGIGQ